MFLHSTEDGDGLSVELVMAAAGNRGQSQADAAEGVVGRAAGYCAGQFCLEHHALLR